MLSRISFRSALIPLANVCLRVPKPSETLIRTVAQKAFGKPVVISCTRSFFSDSFKKARVVEGFESDDAFFENNLRNPKIRAIGPNLHCEIKQSGSGENAYPVIISITSREGQPIEMSSKEIYSLLRLSIVNRALQGITEDEVRTLYIHPKLFFSLKLPPSLIVLEFRGTVKTSSSDSSSIVEDYFIFSTVFQRDPLGINPLVSHRGEEDEMAGSTLTSCARDDGSDDDDG